MACHSSILAWEAPWTEEPSRFQSVLFQDLDTIQRLNHQRQRLCNDSCTTDNFSEDAFLYFLLLLLIKAEIFCIQGIFQFNHNLWQVQCLCSQWRGFLKDSGHTECLRTWICLLLGFLGAAVFLKLPSSKLKKDVLLQIFHHLCSVCIRMEMMFLTVFSVLSRIWRCYRF